MRHLIYHADSVTERVRTLRQGSAQFDEPIQAASILINTFKTQMRIDFYR